MRWLVGDMWYLNTAFRGSRVPTCQHLRRSGAGPDRFVVRPSRFDRTSVSDPWPMLAELNHTVRTHALPKVRRV